MVDFTSLLKKPAGEASKPKALEAGDYPGIIKSFEVGDNNKNKTPYVRFLVGITDWAETVSEEDKTNTDGSPVDLSKRQLRRDYYLTDDALWRLDDFIKSCGVEAHGRAYDEVLPELIGAQVMVQVQQYVNQQSMEVGNQVGSLTGA
jgi:hypothetical protein